MSTPLFPTCVVGSLPRDEWVLDILKTRESGLLDHDDADQKLDAAVLSAIRMQEQTGLDYVSDGELRRNSYLRVFVDAVDGYELDAIPPDAFNTGALPAIVAPIVQKRSIAVDHARYLVANTKARTITTLPSPYTMGITMWSEEKSSRAYATPEKAMNACAEIINAEIKRLVALNVDMVQLDEPWLGDLPNPGYRRARHVPNIYRELDLYVEAINQSVEGVEGISTAVHVCGHTSPTTSGSLDWPFDTLFDALGRMNVDQFTIAMSGPNMDGFSTLRHFPKDKSLGLGVLNTVTPLVETADDVVARVERAMENVPKERIALNPDCGFAPSRRNRRDIDYVYKKLKTMCAAAETLRVRHN